jgi:hypothetical protein
MDSSDAAGGERHSPLEAVAASLLVGATPFCDFSVKVKTLDEGLLTVLVPAGSDSVQLMVSDLKLAIRSSLGLDVDMQRLIYRGKVMQDSDSLVEHHIETNVSVVHLIARSADPTTASPNYGALVSPQASPGRFSLGDSATPDRAEVAAAGRRVRTVATGGAGPRTPLSPLTGPPRSPARPSAVTIVSDTLSSSLLQAARSPGYSAMDAAALEQRHASAAPSALGPGALLIARPGQALPVDGEAAAGSSVHAVAAAEGVRTLSALSDWSAAARASLGVAGAASVDAAADGARSPLPLRPSLPALESINQGLHTLRTVMTAMGWGGGEGAGMRGPTVDLVDRLPVGGAGRGRFGPPDAGGGEGGEAAENDGLCPVPPLAGFLDAAGGVVVDTPGSARAPPFASSPSIAAAASASHASLTLTEASPGEDVTTLSTSFRTRRYFAVGQWVDVLDTVEQWLEAQVVRVSRGEWLRVHYAGWPERWDEWLHASSPRIAPFRSRSQHATLPFGACPWPVNLLPGQPRVGLPNRIVETPPSDASRPNAAGVRTLDCLASTGVVTFSSPSISVSLFAGEEDPRPALVHAVDGLGLTLGLLTRLSALTSEQVRREARRAGLLAGLPALAVYGEGVGVEALPPEAPLMAMPAPPPPSYGGFLSYESVPPPPGGGLPGPLADAEQEGKTSVGGGGSGGPHTASHGPGSPRATGSRLVMEAREAAARVSRVRDYQQGLEDRGEVAVLAAQLAPLLDRVGRVLTDLAPHCEALARAPSFVPARTVAIELPPPPAPSPEAGGGGLEGGLSALITRLRSQVTRVRADTARLSGDVARLRGEVEAASPGTQEEGGAASSSSTAPPSPLPPRSGLLVGGSSSSPSSRVLPGLFGAALGATSPSTSPRGLCASASLGMGGLPYAYPRLVSTPAMRDAASAGYTALVRSPLSVPMDVDILSVRQPGYALRAGDGSLSLLHAGGRPPPPVVVPMLVDRTSGASMRLAPRVGGLGSGGPALAALTASLEAALGDSLGGLSTEQLASLYGQVLVEEYLADAGGRAAAATEEEEEEEEEGEDGEEEEGEEEEGEEEEEAGVQDMQTGGTTALDLWGTGPSDNYAGVLNDSDPQPEGDPHDESGP